ncbi:hypothetical protein [Thioalkalivibrio sp. ALE23]|uniref:hypothetical protein n=1 Tax=Thioalkalivibrio sp. ALE23 TaxID=1265495 RepID=UPI0003730D6D|nr:hypothetical protein [Thioalkalivibrio sp. ALE23]
MKRSIYCSDPIEKLLSQYDPGDDGEPMRSTSGAINTAVDRYLEVVRRSMPAFQLNEWGLIFESLNGVWMQEGAGMIEGSLKLGISDSISLDRLDQKWEVEGDALLAKLQALTYCQQVAVIDAAERFWSQPNRGSTLREEIALVVEERCIED